MCLIAALRLAFKKALLSGRVYHVQEQNAVPVVEHLPEKLTSDMDFADYQHPLSQQQWAAFQDSERAFRARLNTRPERRRFATSGDPGEWARLIKLLIGVFFKNGIYSTVTHGEKQLGFPLLKYVTRILRKFPLEQLPGILTPFTIADWIEVQLRFICDTIRPQLGPTTTHKRHKRVSRNKLAYLWQHRKSKAIQINLNNSEYPEPPPCPSDITLITSHYENKCLGQTSINDPLPLPPWDEQ